LNKPFFFKGCYENICYKLEAVKINYSSIKYKIEENKEGLKCYSESVLADLNHNFYYFDKDDEYEDKKKYSIITSDSCSFIIRIGTNSNNILCAKLERSFCKNETNNIYNGHKHYLKN
jgi:hypothetical protein